ncbi:type II toxin-antitoxin system HigB family toxin [Pseudomonas sp. UBA4194]|uniref:type II toxin-antitoxin system HigB family toxin n=1 Tax=Pseudomonas sp. UBA4194 TaxID=1947317 RepID=UPI0025DD18EC|nr:type II toxin-antitoxin system HigB family toxin [Pseudomonas sp. UBA4194]
MRVIAKSAVTQAMRAHSQWQAALSLWLATFDRPAVRFESFDQLRGVWLEASGWNVDRVPHSRLRPTSRKGPLDIYVFDIKRNECRIVSWINVNNGTIFIKAILSHAAYDKWCKADVK